MDMIRLYHSEDPGLLDNLIQEFKDQYPGAKHVRRPTSSELELLLIQRNFDCHIENLIIEHYGGSLDVLDNILLHAGLENTLILLTYPPYGELLSSIENRDMELKKLTASTKKGYLNGLLSRRYAHLKLSKELVREMKEKIPACAKSINRLMENIEMLSEGGKVDEALVLEMLGDFGRRVNFFDFMKVYMDEDEGKWLSFWNDGVVCEDTFRQFFHSLSYQLLELKRYAGVRRRENSAKKISSVMKAPIYAVSSYQKLFERYGGRLERWLNDFIIDLYTCQFSIVYSFSVNCALIKHFLLRKRRELSESMIV